MRLATGLDAQAFAFAGGYPGAAVPDAAGVPEGPRTIGQKAFGVTLGGGAGGPRAAGGGAAPRAWGLPRSARPAWPRC
jgi:hypothetical protein